jgi:hypothetical protein
VTREAIDEIILATMRFVRDDDDVSPIGQQRMLGSFFGWEKFLDRCEDHAATRNLKQLLQMLVAFRLHRFLPEQLVAT